jgi:hypothetical protein
MESVKCYNHLLNEVLKKKRFTDEVRQAADKILHSGSHSQEKLEGAKYLIEPLKILQLSIFDPLFLAHQLRQYEGSIYEDDFIFTRRNGEELPVDYKLQTATFSDPLWDIAAPDYCCISKAQFDRYRKNKPTTLLYERQITNFDPSYLAGQKNKDAFDFKKIKYRQTWHYAQITPEEIASWKKGQDYFESLTRGHKPDRLIVFRLSNLQKVKDLTAHVEEGTKRRILI